MVLNMISAVVLLNVDRGLIHDIGEEFSKIKGVHEIYSVTGIFDYVLIVRVTNPEDLEEVITGQVLKLPGVNKSTTLVAFQYFSRSDLNQMFSIGFDSERPEIDNKK